jgi:hypothetical protein
MLCRVTGPFAHTSAFTTPLVMLAAPWAKTLPEITVLLAMVKLPFVYTLASFPALPFTVRWF